jgi:methylglutamate dehydrogenase subunit D
MSEIEVDPTGLAHIAAPGRRGRSAGAAGVSLSLVRDRACAMLIARKGQAGPLADLVQAKYGCALPDGPRRAGSGATAFVATGPMQWLAFRNGGDDGCAFERELFEALGACASIVDQTDARVGVRVAGPKVRNMLAKLLPIDLDQSVFAPGAVASSLIGHISVTVVHLDQSPGFEILVSRSYAESLWRAVAAAGAEFGIDVA